MTDTRTLSTIAREIAGDWAPRGKGIYFGAVPYLQALAQLETVDDMYGADDARGIVRYFLCNATTWRGEVARRVKAELRGMVE
jgi:hypothetical protein